MKLQLDKFLTLTAMMAGAQLATAACTVVDKSDDETAETDDDSSDDGTEAGTVGSGETDDESDDDDVDDDDVDDDSADAGAGAEGDAGNESSAADAGHEDDHSDAGHEEHTSGDGGHDAGAMAGDAGHETGAMSDAGEGDAAADPGDESGDPGGEGNECIGGDVTDPSFEGYDCSMFDSCIESADYAGTAAADCWDFNFSRRADVYDDFISCVNTAQLVDPCDETADFTVSQCALDSDAKACVVAIDDCWELAAECEEFPAETCDATLAPWATAQRDAAIGCMSSFILDFGPNYEGCGLDYEDCLDPSVE